MDESDNLFLALYNALDRLEELDPSCKDEPWFKVLERTVDKALEPHVEKVEPTEH
jgi:hypothetical protein